ncbi:hypothetical protein NDU88_000607, partial [Pleurodeles waltl]
MLQLPEGAGETMLQSEVVLELQIVGSWEVQLRFQWPEVKVNVAEESCWNL